MPSTTTGCVSCASGDGINGGPVWWTDPYTAWAAKKRQDKKQQRKQERAETLDPDIEERLKSLRGEGSASATDGRSEDDIDALQQCGNLRTLELTNCPDLINIASFKRRAHLEIVDKRLSTVVDSKILDLF